jgi:hypothetical protein
MAESRLTEHSCCISSGRKAEYPHITPAELCSAFIPHFGGGSRDALGARYHQRSSLEQTNPFFVLQRAERSDSIYNADETLKRSWRLSPPDYPP